MRNFFIFLAIPLSFALYLVLALIFGFFQRYPVLHYLIALVALFFLGKALWQKFSFYRLGLNLVGWALLLLFGWWTLFFSTFEEQSLAPGESARFSSRLADLHLKNAEGETLALQSLLAANKATLLVFYRGHW